VFLPLECLKRGQSAEVAEVKGDPHWVCRLTEMGLRRGVRVEMIQPGSPCLFQVGTSRVSLRLSDRARILVKMNGQETLPTCEVA
jgi:ferrous iron transport protein A